MRILRLSLFLNYFSLAKNKKKALTIINLGIFLSIFAASSALVSLYVENKISKLEYRLIANSDAKRDFEVDKATFHQFESEINAMEIQYKSFKDFYEFIAQTKFGSKIISHEDKYIPFYYDLDELFFYGEFFSNELKEKELDMEEILEEFTYFETDEENKKRDKKILKDFFSLFLNPSISEKTIKEHNKMLFDSDLKSLLSEIGDEKNLFKYEDENESYQIYIKTEEFLDIMKDALEIIEANYLGWVFAHDEEIKSINEEIIKQSRLERNWVVSIFFLQLITFIIIQFFEISSVNAEIKKFRKVLKK